jgi:hypothetical protein
VREEVAMGCLTALGITALALGKNEGVYATVINSVAAVLLVAKDKIKTKTKE